MSLTVPATATPSSDQDAASSMPQIFSSLIDQGWFAETLVGHLSSRDALALAAAARACRVVRLAPLMTGVVADNAWHNSSAQYSAHRWQRIPLDTEGLQCHSVVLHCQWKDQGWGNVKGMLSVVEGENGRAPDDYKPWSDVVVCGKAPAPHQWTALSLGFVPKRAHLAHYWLWARAGGGGGHSLHVANLQVRAVVYEP